MSRKVTPNNSAAAIVNVSEMEKLIGTWRIRIVDQAGGVHEVRLGGVAVVLVGADRIAANGDTANKVGTYPLAVLAARHGIPFYVVAPLSSSTRRSATGARTSTTRRSRSTDGIRVTCIMPGIFETPLLTAASPQMCNDRRSRRSRACTPARPS